MAENTPRVQICTLVENCVQNTALSIFLNNILGIGQTNAVSMVGHGRRSAISGFGGTRDK